jgi:hypothetical protein
MQVATIATTGQQVEIIAVNGGWTTVHTLGADTREMKVRNGALSGHTTLSDAVAELAMRKTEKAKPAVTPEAVQEGRKNGVVFSGYLPQYEAYKALTTEGETKRSIDKGDAVALRLRPLILTSVYADVSNVTGTSIADLLARFSHLNPGMQRMNLGNMMRRALREAATQTA